MRLRTAAVILVLLFASVPVAVAHAIADKRASERARGLVLRGLDRARPDGPCKTGWEIKVPNRQTSCTHGPDPAPPGIDVTEERSLADIAASSGDGDSTTAEAPPGPLYCDGDGVSGNRVQAVYAYNSEASSNFDSVVPYIQSWARMADESVNESAGKNGGVRHIRWVTTPDCHPDVVEVALSPSAIASFSGTIAEFASLGLARVDRKYVVWVDAYVYCGMANASADDRPSEDNLNNGPGRPGMVARIDRGCWGRARSPIEVHELVHTLGGVQPTAPNGSGNYHCSEESDVMCYDDDGTADGYVSRDGVRVPLRSVCPKKNERLLDCNDDDYFNVAPQPGSWLSTHWNVANSSFLTSEGPASVADTEYPRPTVPRPLIVGRLGRTVVVRVSWESKDPDVAGYWLWMKRDGRPWRYVDRRDLWSNSALLHLRRRHDYRFLVHAFDTAGNHSPAMKGPRVRPRVFQERSKRVSYSGRWHRVYRPQASRNHVALPTAGSVGSRLTFRGKAIAWVSSTRVDGGSADVYLDGHYMRTVTLQSDFAAERQVVFTHRFTYRGLHRIAVIPTDASAPVAVDAFVVLR
jgi:hypothetical protein